MSLEGRKNRVCNPAVFWVLFMYTSFLCFVKLQVRIFSLRVRLESWWSFFSNYLTDDICLTSDLKVDIVSWDCKAPHIFILSTRI